MPKCRWPTYPWDPETHGLPLGIIPEAEYDPTTVLQPAPGDMLVLMADGFYEWDRPDGE